MELTLIDIGGRFVCLSSISVLLLFFVRESFYYACFYFLFVLFLMYLLFLWNVTPYGLGDWNQLSEERAASIFRELLLP
jgi:hypothetical protein